MDFKQSNFCLLFTPKETAQNGLPFFRIQLYNWWVPFFQAIKLDLATRVGWLVKYLFPGRSLFSQLLFKADFPLERMAGFFLSLSLTLWLLLLVAVCCI